MKTNNRAILLFDWIYITVQSIANGFTQMVVNIFNDVVTNLAMVVVPVLPAYSVYNVLQVENHPSWVSIVGALAVEFAGIFISKTFFDVMSWHRVKNKSDESVNFKIVLVAGSIFYGLIFVNTLAIEIFPSAHVALIPSFVLLAPCTYAAGFTFFQVRALRDEFDKRQAESAEKTRLGKEIMRRKRELDTLTSHIKNTIKGRTQSINQDIEKARSELEIVQEKVEQAKAELNGTLVKVEAKNEHNGKIASLKPGMKKVYRLTVSTDLPAKAIASEIGVTERTVQTYWKSFRESNLIDENRNEVDPLTHLNGRMM